MTTIRVEVLDSPSRSKGWARYALTGDGGRAVTESTTGNRWVSGTTKEGEAEEGETLTLTSQVMLRVGKQRREERSNEGYVLVAEDGATADVYHRPGSQGQRIRVTGARLVDR